MIIGVSTDSTDHLTARVRARDGTNTLSGHVAFPVTTVSSLEENTFWDGLFHASALVFVTVGVFLLWRVLSAGYRVTWRSMVGLLFAGWGFFNLVEGVIDHHILTVHHVRDDVADPMWWDLGFLGFGAVLVLVGFCPPA